MFPNPMRPDQFVIGIDADLYKPKTISLSRRWKRFSSLQRTVILISILCTVYIFFQIFSSPESKSEFIENIPTKNKGLIPVLIPRDQDEDFVVKKTPKLVEPSLKPRQPGGVLRKGAYKSQGPTNERMDAVVGAFNHSWKAYKKYAWGKDELLPQTRSSSRWFDLGLTIIEALDTMYIMDLKEEFKEARDWVEKSLNLDVNSNVNLFECTIRVLGGLLSAYHLSADQLFLDKAKYLGDRLMPAFHSNSPVPFSDVNLMSGQARSPSWSSESTTSEVSSVQIEFTDLSRLTGDDKYEKVAMKVSEHLHNQWKKQGLVPIFINPSTGRFRQTATITMGARGDSYYEYLLKIYLQTGNTQARDDYIESMKGVEELLMRETSASKLLYLGELLGGSSFSPKMDHLVCFLGGNLALAAKFGLNPEKFFDFGKRLTDTCIQFYTRMATGLSPEIVHFKMAAGSSVADEMFVKTADSHNLLRPETVESLFYLYRLTGNTTYQDIGWDIFQAFEKYTKLENGYTSIGNVQNTKNVHPRNKMESFWVAETLKYFYLLFGTDPSYISLDEFIFNTEAHLLPYRTVMKKSENGGTNNDLMK